MRGGIRVIDLTRVLGGPYAAQILADHGLEVVRLSQPLVMRCAAGGRLLRVAWRPAQQ